MARVDPDTICLVGMWQSDTILRYFHTTAKSFTEGLSDKMFQHGAYTLIPHSRALKAPFAKGFCWPGT